MSELSPEDQAKIDALRQRVKQPQDEDELTLKCPKCGHQQDQAFTECPSCGVIIAKYYQVQKKIAANPPKNTAIAKPKQVESKSPDKTDDSKTLVCQACGGLVSKSVKACPHCGESVANSHLRKNIGCLKGTFIILGFVIFLGWLINNVLELGGGPRPEFDSVSAQLNCEKQVKMRLKAPSSAKFAPYGDLNITRPDEKTWRVFGWVDAQNGFGAMIRNHYTCTITYLGNGKIRVDSINIE